MMTSPDIHCTLPLPLEFTEEVPASVKEVWQAWITEEGAKTFFAPDCLIQPRVGGSYEMYFDLDAPKGSRGGEGCEILAMEDQRMLSFTWNAPPEIPSVRCQHTHVAVYFEPLTENTTRVTLVHDGWGTGEDWQKTRGYFIRAWGEVVLPRLKSRFTYGPIQWNE